MTKTLSFSERYGYKKVCNTIQTECMSAELRTDVFNIIVITLLVCGTSDSDERSCSIEKSFYNHYYDAMWANFSNRFYATVLGEPLTKVPGKHGAWDRFEKYFFEAEWHQIYSLLEWFLLFFSDEEISEHINKVLEDDCSGYRIIDKKVVPITDKNEVIEVEKALQQDEGGAVHLSAALKFLSDKNTKDYRNSIKESISAVEKLVRDITGESTLGKALKRLEKNGVIIPKFLKQGFENIYTWTNEADGIRHALMTDDDNLSCAEAQFMLIACSAFINYLKSKQSKGCQNAK